MHRFELILTQIREPCVILTPTHFRSNQDSWRSLSASVKPGKVWNAKLCLPNHIPVRNADWFKCHFWQLYFKADWSEIHFISTLSFPFYAFVLTWAENISLVLPGLHVWRSTWQQSLRKISPLRERKRSIKAAKKDPSATIVASIHSTGATGVGSINVTEF